MVSPGTLRMLGQLTDGSIERFEPRIDTETGDVSYPEAAAALDEGDAPPYELLESLADRGILGKEFQEKTYICPNCREDGMQFTTVCGACDSPHTVETELFEHLDCGYTDAQSAFEVEDGYVCPGCGESLQSFDHTERGRQYVCQNCGERAERPENALSCRHCGDRYAPMEAIERVLCRYGFTQSGSAWFDRQLAAREATVETLRGRGFDVAADTTVSGESGTHPVHVYAEDELLDSRMVAAVHEYPDRGAAERLRDVARDVGARAMLVTTRGTISGGAAGVADESGISVLSADDGELRRELEVRGEQPRDSGFVERLTSAMRQ